jgi:hypothetical protein
MRSLLSSLVVSAAFALCGVAVMLVSQPANATDYIQKCESTSGCDDVLEFTESSIWQSSGGRIAIGNNLSARDLTVSDVNADGVTGIHLHDYTGADSLFLLTYDDGEAFIGTAGGYKKLNLGVDWRTSVMILDSYGHVGINKSPSGSYALDIGGGSVRVDYGSNLVLQDDANDPGDLIMLNSAGTEYGRAWSDAGGMYLRANSAVGATLVLDHDYARVGILIDPSYAFHSASTSYYNNNQHWYTTSDRRLKKNIHPLTGALDQLAKVQPVEFEWVDDLADEPGYGKGVRAGFIAQDLEQSFPSWVEEADPPETLAHLVPAGDKVKGINLPTGYDALVIQAIKELRAENDDLKALVCADHPEADICNR